MSQCPSDATVGWPCDSMHPWDAAQDPWTQVAEAAAVLRSSEGAESALPLPVLTNHFIMNPSDTQQGHPTGSKNEVLTEIWESAEIPSYTNPKRLTLKTGNKGPISCQQKGNSTGIVCVPQSKSRDGGNRGKTFLMSS